ncbi:MAG: 5-formyltetrahydrofolate cyclo-ligase [Hyphomicrobiaceae bacterium]
MTNSSSPPDDDEGQGSYASPPCFMHELDPLYGGIAPDPAASRDVSRWRKAERERLIAARKALPVAAREEHARLIARDLDRLVPRSAGTIVSLYWPFRGEPDLRPWMAEVCAAGLRTALPVVVAKGQPLVFREWTPDARLERGVWNIPFPADGAVVTPTVIIAPLVGFDAEGYRLGYGGGFFDRTLATMASKPLIIGVGHLTQKITTIYPQPHDIGMDWIVTGHEAPVPGKASS